VSAVGATVVQTLGNNLIS